MLLAAAKKKTRSQTDHWPDPALSFICIPREYRKHKHRCTGTHCTPYLSYRNAGGSLYLYCSHTCFQQSWGAAQEIRQRRCRSLHTTLLAANLGSCVQPRFLHQAHWTTVIKPREVGLVRLQPCLLKQRWSLPQNRQLCTNERTWHSRRHLNLLLKSRTHPNFSSLRSIMVIAQIYLHPFNMWAQATKFSVKKVVTPPAQSPGFHFPLHKWPAV